MLSFVSKLFFNFTWTLIDLVDKTNFSLAEHLVVNVLERDHVDFTLCNLDHTISTNRRVLYVRDPLITVVWFQNG